VRRAGLLTVIATLLLAAGCATDPGEVTGSIAKVEPKPLLPPPPIAPVPDKPVALTEPECKSLISHMQSCTQRIRDKEKKAVYHRRTVEVAQTLASMDAGQRKATCKADLPQWRKDCGAP
jgi:hypothetical protein